MADKKFLPTVGADPEVFLVDKEGKPVPVCGLIGAEKGKPKALQHMPMLEHYRERLSKEPNDALYYREVLASALIDKLPPAVRKATSLGGVVEDNVMVEFNPAPATTPDGFVYNMWANAFSFQRTYLQDRGWAMRAVSDLMFTDDIHQYPQAMQFGCDPDRCVYLGDRLRDPIQAADLGNLRFAGGHIHIGYDVRNSALSPDDVAVLCDMTLGLYSVLNERSPSRRRQYYGLAGLYRTKEYGVEYRSMSNFWLNSAGHASAVARMALSVAHVAGTESQSSVYAFMNACNVMAVKEAVDTGDETMANDCLVRIQKNLHLLDPFENLSYTSKRFGRHYDNIPLIDAA